MASLANGGGVVEFVAIDADAHRGHARNLRHGGEFRHLSVAGFTFDSGIQMLAVRPVYSLCNCVDAYPGDGLAGLGKRSKPLNGWFLRCDREVAGHASGGRGESH